MTVTPGITHLASSFFQAFEGDIRRARRGKDANPLGDGEMRNNISTMRGMGDVAHALLNRGN